MFWFIEFLIIFALLLIILTIKVSVGISFKDGFSISISLIFIKLTLFIRGDNGSNGGVSPSFFLGLYKAISATLPHCDVRIRDFSLSYFGIGASNSILPTIFIPAFYTLLYDRCHRLEYGFNNGSPYFALIELRFFRLFILLFRVLYYYVVTKTRRNKKHARKSNE